MDRSAKILPLANRLLLTLVVSASASISPGFCQQPAPATPQKPYRERLLERARNGDVEAQFELGKNYETGRIHLPRSPGS